MADFDFAEINTSNIAGESTVFVSFMLEVIRDALKDVLDSQSKRQERKLTAKTLASILGFTPK